MGTSRTAAQLGQKVQRTAKRIESANKAAVNVAAGEMKQTITGLMAGASGGDLVLSGMTRTTGPKRSNRGGIKKLGVRYRVESRARGPQAYLRATGPAHLVEDDQPKHPVVSRYAKAGSSVSYLGKKGKRINSRSSRQARGIAVRLGEATTGDRRAVLHWGNNYARWTVASSKGRHPWKHGVAASAPKARATMRQAARQAFVTEFR